MALKTRGKAAYFLVDLSVLSDSARQQVLEEVLMGGGGESGVRVVEEVYNGPIVQPIYGVYYGPDEERWAEFQAADAGDQTVGVETDEEREERLRAAATRTADQQAADRLAAEEAEIRAITKEPEPEVAAAPHNKNRR